MKIITVIMRLAGDALLSAVPERYGHIHITTKLSLTTQSPKGRTNNRIFTEKAVIRLADSFDTHSIKKPQASIEKNRIRYTRIMYCNIVSFVCIP